MNGTVVARPEFRHMYWSPEQMLAHLTVNGASLRNGDLFASGTVQRRGGAHAREPPRADLERSGPPRPSTTGPRAGSSRTVTW